MANNRAGHTSPSTGRSQRPFWGGVFVHPDGGGDGRQDARLFWQTGWDPSVIAITAEPVPLSDPDAFDIAHFPHMADLVTDGNGAEILLLADGPRQIQLEVGEGTLHAGPVKLHYRLAGFDHLSEKALTMTRLDTFRRLGRFPKSLFPPERAAAKWLKALRAYDGQQAGASQREIAAVVFGQDLVRDEWNGRSEFLRNRIQRLVRYARRMVDGGYRQLLG